MTLDQDQIEAALPSYEIGAELGRGGWGVVLAGTHRQLGRQVAIKQLPRAFAADPDVRARFVAEARVLASLDHPHIVPVYDYVEQDGLCLLVMEQLPGRHALEPVLHRRLHPAGGHRRGAGQHRRAPGGARAPHPAPRREAGEPHVLGVGRAQGHRLRHRQGGRAARAPWPPGPARWWARPPTSPPSRPAARRSPPPPTSTRWPPCSTSCCRASCPSPTTATPWPCCSSTPSSPPCRLLDVAPFVPGPLAEVVMRGLATDPADRYPSAEEFGVAIAEAATSAWGPGWLAAEGTPVMGASVHRGRHRPGHDAAPGADPGRRAVAPAESMEAAPAPPTIGEGAPARTDRRRPPLQPHRLPPRRRPRRRPRSPTWPP